MDEDNAPPQTAVAPHKAATPRRKRSPRLDEIAAAAGVSLATVDRVLNERDSVSETARAKVVAAAQALGVRRLLPDARRQIVHLDILMPRNETPFFQRLTAALRDAAAMLDRGITVHRRTLSEGNTAEMIRALESPAYPRAGVIFAAPDEPAVRAAIAKALARGEKLVSIVTDLPGITGVDYRGPDNLQAGATAGFLLGRLTPQPGRVLLLSSRPDYRSHQDRAAGFRSVIARTFPHLTVEAIDTDTRDDPERCLRAVKAALARGPVAALYNTGAGSAGIHQALRPLAQRPVWVTHEVSDDHVALLKRGAMDIVIDQNPDGQAMAALQTLLHRCGLLENGPVEAETELRIYTPENLPRRSYAPG
jgi:LacI family transcriptional regulator